MNTPEPFLPKATADKLAAHHPKGTRHQAALEIAYSMIGNGWSESRVLQELKASMPDMPEKELADLVHGAARKNPPPSTPNAAPRSFSRPAMTKRLPIAEARKSPVERATWWLNGATEQIADFTAASPTQIPNDPAEALILTLNLMWLGPENLNIVCQYVYDPKEDKARPSGPGRIMTRDKWLDYVASKGVPSSNAGAWLRPNPVLPAGSGTAGSVTDSDVTAFRYLLLESDVLPLEIQLALYRRLRLPIACVTTSGGNSAHAWLRVDAKTAEQFSDRAERIMSALEPLGIDHKNKNPSRLSRLPGSARKIGATGDGAQRLLWLDISARMDDDAQIDALERSVLCPCTEDKPFRRLIAEALPRYEWMIANKGRLGVPTGFASFDRVSGGLKANGYTLVAANTGVGKSTIALNIINAALKASYGVVLFTLEMTREDITDMMFSMNARVDRNHFNTGEFTNEDVDKMSEQALWMKDLPLWVDDSPECDVALIANRTLQLRAENKIGLVVVDYAQLVPLGLPSQNREHEVGQVAMSLRVLSKKSGIPFVLLSQLNDDGLVRESRRLAHEAANVMVLSRDNNDLMNPNMTLKVTKGRKIPCKPIPLYLKAEYCLITERSPISNDDIPKHHTND